MLVVVGAGAMVSVMVLIGPVPLGTEGLGSTLCDCASVPSGSSSYSTSSSSPLSSSCPPGLPEVSGPLGTGAAENIFHL